MSPAAMAKATFKLCTAIQMGRVAFSSACRTLLFLQENVLFSLENGKNVWFAVLLGRDCGPLFIAGNMFLVGFSANSDLSL